ncbi:MAG TPA: choice-of-anchor A family protein [Telmatospirillum sp.]|nr:choice-of-anchor A family protein [Telmatospirillum sp.]
MTNKVSSITLLLTSVTGMMFLSSEASATTLATDILNDYNLVVFGSLSSTSEVDGKAFVGGNASGGNYQIHTLGSVDQKPILGGSAIGALTVGGALTGNVNVNGAGLTVGGNLSTNSLNLNGGGTASIGGNVTSAISNNNGSIVVGGSITSSGNTTSTNLTVGGNVSGQAHVNNGALNVVGSALSGASITVNGNTANFGGTLQPGANVSVSNGTAKTGQSVAAPVLATIPTATYQSELTAYSQQLKSLAQNSAYSINGSVVTFNAAPNASGVAVFDITNAASFFSISNEEFKFSLNGAKEVIINVSGAGSNTLNINANFLNGIAQTLGTDTIWNFTDAQNVTIGRQFGGDFLGVYANLTTTANVEGTVVAKSVVQGAEIHYDGQNTGLVSPVPLPGALPLFGAALAGMAGFARRKRNHARIA